ncbi:MAG TPA: sensor histidine kinase [Stellaceae bacterium]|nr:sensor histidine kinase [Stellaceae bacterium]
MSLFQRLLLVVTLAILPAVVIQVSNEIALRRERVTEGKNVALRLAYELGDEMGHSIAGARQFLAAVVRLPSVVQEDGARCTAALVGMRDAHPAYTAVDVVGPDGRVFCSSVPADIGATALGRTYVRDTLARDHFTVDGYARDEVSGVPVVHFSMPFRSVRGGRGVAFAVLPLARLESSLQSRPLPRGASFVVADRAGTVVATSAADEAWIGEALPDIMMQRLRGGAPRVERLNGLDGGPLFFGFVPISASPPYFFIGAGIDTAAAMAPIVRATERGAVLIMAGLLLALLVTWVTGKFYIDRPISAILAAIQHWHDGDYAARAQVDHPVREIGRVIAAFHRLADRLQNRERQIAERDAALRRAYKGKDLLLAAVGHDLRQPLQTIAIVLERMAGCGAHAPDRTMVTRAERAVDRMSATLDQLIDVAHLEMGALAVEAASMEIGAVLDEVADTWSERAARKGLRLRVVRSGAIVRSDRVALAIIVNNLVGNAVRYTERGGILLGCRHRGGRLVVEVHDTGIGIAAKAIPVAFEQFRQLDPAASEGFGLGLSIVKGLAEQLQHPLAVRSRPGAGSCFAISVPLDAREALAA